MDVKVRKGQGDGVRRVAKHRDRKKAIKRGERKHKGRAYV